jgi:hypothetical protein
MPKLLYESTNFSPASREIIQRANTIIASFHAQGIDLTLRSLYYKFVAGDYFPETYIDPKTGSKNNERSYKKLGDVVANARLAGLIDWSAILDRTRRVQTSSHWDSPADILGACAAQFRIDKWASQPNYVEVWAEKDAVLSVLEVACVPLEVPYYACRGYNSLSEIWNAGYNRFRPQVQAGKKCHIIYMGDHDPSGMDMPRNVEERVNQFAGTNQVHAGDVIRVRRLALNMDQILEYNPPPNPTKQTDSRSSNKEGTGYIDKYGDESWELDALDPIVLRDMITAAVKKLRNDHLWLAAVEEENGHKDGLARCAANWAKVVAFLNKGKKP